MNTTARSAFRMRTGVLLGIILASTPAIAADLPIIPHHHHRRFAMRREIRPVESTFVLPPSRNVCAPGYAFATPSGPCLRHGELAVRCTPSGFCEPLPPDPIPYGIGPYLRLNY